ncbi:ECF-type sigma factor [Porphyrobacter sp. HT-58-2]|uniref:ECF-type sigma factor n=1 Tax=Porphyrobacter sp. HT-58-2 TaxID=2023229 RepID=UPI001558D47D|nr:ECF-type sigma factor [Porphyrobacter sp. HT-58-2]
MHSDKDAILDSYSEQDQFLAAELVNAFHGELIDIARARRRRAKASDTLMTLDVLHEAFLKLDGKQGFRSPGHFLAVASLAMRQVIVDHARRKLAEKRQEAEDQRLAGFGETPEQMVAIGQLLGSLGAHNPRWLRIVDARYFAGLTEAETAAVLGISERTVRRDWQDARRWLAKRLG